MTSAGIILGGTFAVFAIVGGGGSGRQPAARDRLRPRRRDPDGHVPRAHAARAGDRDPARPLELVAVEASAAPRRNRRGSARGLQPSGGGGRLMRLGPCSCRLAGGGCGDRCGRVRFAHRTARRRRRRPGAAIAAPSSAQIQARVVLAKCLRAHGIDVPDSVGERWPGGPGRSCSSSSLSTGYKAACSRRRRTASRASQAAFPVLSLITGAARAAPPAGAEVRRVPALARGQWPGRPDQQRDDRGWAREGAQHDRHEQPCVPVGAQGLRRASARERLG